MKTEFCQDCIHLKACRRMAKIYKSNGSKFVARGCNEDCSAYLTADEIADKAARVANDLLSDLRYGYSPDDLCVESSRFMADEISEIFE